MARRALGSVAGAVIITALIVTRSCLLVAVLNSVLYVGPVQPSFNTYAETRN